MRKTLSMILILVISISLGACGSNVSNDELKSLPNSNGEQVFELKLGTIRDDQDPATQALKEFIKLVEEKSDGTIKITLYNNSALGGLTELLSGMQFGSVDMVHDRISCYGILAGAGKFNIIAAPFLWESYEELEGFLNSEEANTWFDQAAHATGVRCFMAKGKTEARQLTANKPVKTVEDFLGLKVRTAEIPVVQQTMKALGAQPVVIPFSDLYMALRQGTADAQENGFLTVKNASLYEVQDYLMKTDYILDSGAFYISEKIWDSMSEKQQKVLVEAASEAANIQTKKTDELINETLDFLKEEMEYIEPDIASFQEKLGDSIYEEFDAEGRAWDTGAYEIVKKYKEQNN